MSNPSKPIGKTLLAMAFAVHATACSTPGYFVAPSISLKTVYVDNLFFASEDKESDVIARVSPEIEFGYASETLSWSGRYRFDAEAYNNHTELNDAQTRSFAGIDVAYQPTSRLTLRAAAEFTKTNTPTDLNLVSGGAIPGLLFGRIEAERLLLQSAASYRITAPTTAFLSVAQTQEELTERIDIGKSDIRVLDAYIEQRISEVSTLSYGNMYRQYRFDTNRDEGPAKGDNLNSNTPLIGLPHPFNAGTNVTALAHPLLDGSAANPYGPVTLDCFCANGEALLDHDGANQNSNTPWIGMSHQFNERTRVTARTGPRLDGSSVDPYVRLSLQRLYTNGEVLLDYERNETTLLGVPGKMQIQTIYSTVSHRFASGLELQVIPGYAQVYQTGLSVDIYSLVVGAVYKLNESVLLMAGYDLNLQQVNPVGGGSFEVSRNVIQVGVRFAFPRREPR